MNTDFEIALPDTVNLLCSCALETERIDHFYIRCQSYAWLHLTNELGGINSETVSLRPTALSEVIAYSDKKLNDKLNHQILNTTTIYTKYTQRFEHAPLWVTKSNPLYNVTLNLSVCFS